MFLDTMEPRTENKYSSLEKTVLIIWAQICGQNCPNCPQSDIKKFKKIRTSMGYFFALCNLRRNLYMFLDYIELRIENKKSKVRKNGSIGP